jgi:hypothetical protein
MKMLECKILEFAAKLTHPKPVRNRSEDIHRLLSYALALFGSQVVKGPHVMQTVREFNENDTDVLDHRQQHLSDVFGLLLFVGNRANLRNFGQAIDKQCYFVAEIFANCIEVNERVFNNVVKQTGRDRHFVKPHVCQYIGNLKRMYEIRFPGSPCLTLVFPGREEIGSPEQVEIRLRVVAADLFNDVFDPNHVDNRWPLIITC